MMNREYLIFKAYAGSKLYGTDSESSDLDIKGIFLPNKRDLILGKAPKHYTNSTGKDGEKNNKEDIDETYYSLHYFLELVSKGDTNGMDLLFAYTNKNAVIETSSIYDRIIQNLDKLVTKNIKAYLGYCKSQCIKYSLKGDKLNNYTKFKDFCIKYSKEKKDGTEQTLKNTFIKIFGEEFLTWIPEVEERVLFRKLDFGDHCYLETSWNHENYLSVSDIKFDLNDTLMTALHKVEKSMKRYGVRAENAAKDNGADYKAISHCVRVILQVEELLTTNKIVFPLKDREFIKSIKYKTTSLSYEEIMNWIEAKIKYIEEILLPQSDLREKADFKWIEEFILSCY